MIANRILITGGAGFVGSSLAERMAASGMQVTALDNLMRRGSALNVKRLESQGVCFRHGDVRCLSDWADLPTFDLIVDCAAEPSVQAGLRDTPMRVVEINFGGTLHALEKARQDGSAFLFLSSSRVYSIPALQDIRLRETATRLVPYGAQELSGISPAGITESFPCDSFRSFYGASKYACELFIQEYVALYGLRALINRCGILAGRHQMGKADQGIMAFWAARHFFGQPLAYTGFGGTGKQVRDALHPDDLFALIERQLADVANWRGEIYNVGGGPDISFSLLELTETCRTLSGHTLDIATRPDTYSVDIPYYVSDTTRVRERFGWNPQRGIEFMLEDIFSWLAAEQNELRGVFS